MNDNFVRRNLKRRFKGTYKKKRKTGGRGKVSNDDFVGKIGSGNSYAFHLKSQGSDINDINNEAPSLGLDPLKVCRII